MPAGAAVAVEIPFRFALWLASGVLVLDPDAMDALYYQYVPCIERIGAAIDKALSGVSGDSPRSASQLRKEMRRAARRHRAAGMGQAYLVSLVDLYEVANAFPTGVGVDHCYDWIGLTSLGMLIDNEDSLTVAYGSLEQCLGLRFDDAAALAVNGPDSVSPPPPPTPDPRFPRAALEPFVRLYWSRRMPSRRATKKKALISQTLLRLGSQT